LSSRTCFGIWVSFLSKDGSIILDGQRRTALPSDERVLDSKRKAILKIIEMLKRVQMTNYRVSRISKGSHTNHDFLEVHLIVIPNLFRIWVSFLSKDGSMFLDGQRRAALSSVQHFSDSRFRLVYDSPFCFFLRVTSRD